MSGILIAAATVNFLTFILYGIDKLKAVNGWWRIPESLLLILTLAGGSAGALISMLLFRHKTQKPVFVIVVLLSLLVQVYLLTIYLS